MSLRQTSKRKRNKSRKTSQDCCFSVNISIEFYASTESYFAHVNIISTITIPSQMMRTANWWWRWLMRIDENLSPFLRICFWKIHRARLMRKSFLFTDKKAQSRAREKTNESIYGKLNMIIIGDIWHWIIYSNVLHRKNLRSCWIKSLDLRICLKTCFTVAVIALQILFWKLKSLWVSKSLKIKKCKHVSKKKSFWNSFESF